MSAAFTPGPWYVGGPYFGRYDIYSNHSVGGRECLSGHQSVAICHHTSKKQTPAYGAMFDANARLISAAPDLLAAAQWAEAWITGFDDDNPHDDVSGMLRALRAAIAKALPVTTKDAA